MLELLTLKPKAFGLDISNLSLKIAMLKKKGRFFDLASWGETEIKPGTIEEGEIRDQDALVKIIKEGIKNVKGKKLKTKNVVVSLPEKEAFLEVIQMPKMDQEELKSAIPYEAENYIPLPIEKVYLDFQIISPVKNHLDHLDVLITAFPKKTIDSYVSCLKKAGLIPYALEIESQSIVRALIKNGVSPSPIFIIDFGRTNTRFIIFSGHSLRFTSSIPISSQKLTEDISQNLKIDLKEAEKLKIKHGLQFLKKKNGDGKDKKISEAMAPALTELAEQIKKYVDYYQTHVTHEHFAPNGKMVDKVLLCGRGANLKGFEDFLSSSLGILTERANPWINILPKPPKEVRGLSFQESLGFTTALGLAIRGIRENKQ